ncbi:hypothetical protein S7711_01938 [Stachybotrys chartarum IBT 7711]|uniref:Allergen Asp f 4 n=1 Tax=Stachybotrys chartarum (strain CBS 109288 / IBT 7711) TaxID=1280523 RepID=A0A084AMW5_STACB|nr:hypothetical protein S7711_01938 [Stachybotrys chartarum IBT 7711]KFA48773.1 hypothetical protein S40293_01541 [Stachybotrys chartarum IBT 40293]
MKFSATALLLTTAALGVSAHPSGHHHMHRSVGKRGNFYMANRPAPEPTTTSVAPAPVATSAAPAPVVQAVEQEEQEEQPEEDTSSDDDSSSGSGTVKPFCGGNYKRATAAEIAYTGNTGAPGNYGCNLMIVDNDVADEYKYTTTFTNDSGEDQSCVCFLKIGPEGLINGFFEGNQAVNFDLPAGGKRVLAADENSQGGCACGAGGVPLTSHGGFASTWLEFDFGNTSNDGWSGADASCLVSAAYGLDIPGLQVCGHGTCSTINPGGTGTNAYLGGMEALDGVGLNIVPGKARLNVVVGYQG